MKKTLVTTAIVLFPPFQGPNLRIIGIAELLIHKFFHYTSEVLGDHPDVKMFYVGNPCVLTAKPLQPVSSWTMTFCHRIGATGQDTFVNEYLLPTACSGSWYAIIQLIDSFIHPQRTYWAPNILKVGGATRFGHIQSLRLTRREVCAPKQR